MQNQKMAGGEENPFGAQTQEEIKTKPLSVQVPDVHETMKLAGAKNVKLGSAEKNKRVICCCGDQRCGIGPMTIVQEVP